MSNIFVRMLGFDGHGGGNNAAGEISGGIANIRDTTAACEGLDLPVKGNQSRVVSQWSERLSRVADLTPEPSSEQLKAMTVLAGGMPDYVKQHTQYYRDAKTALQGLGTIAKEAIGYDAAVTEQGFKLVQAQQKAAARILDAANNLHRDTLLFRGKQIAAGMSSPNLRSYGAQAGGFM
jgi:hypothetical protein